MPKSPYQTPTNQKGRRTESQFGESLRGFAGSGRWRLRPGVGDPADGAGGSFLARSPPRAALRTRALGHRPRGKPGLGFSSPAEEPRLCLGRVAGFIVPVLGKPGSQLVKGNLSLGKGEALQSWRRWTANIYAGGECGKLAELFHSLSPNPTKLLTVTRAIYRIRGALED